MKQIFTAGLLALVLLTTTGIDLCAQATRKVTYNKSTFPIYEPLNLPPTPLCGLKPDKPGYTIKSPLYGPTTYYTYAPGNVPKTNYTCLLTEIRDWVFYRPDYVKQQFDDWGYTPMTLKAIKKMAGKTRLPNGGLMYQLSDSTWMWFYLYGLQNCGPRPWGSNEEHACGVSYIRLLPKDPKEVLDVMLRFWNDGVHIGNSVGVTQHNFKAKPSAPNSLNPNNFTMGDVVHPKKGFHTLTFEGGNGPTYHWHSYLKVIEENMASKKQDFDAEGSIKHDDLKAAFEYTLDIVQVKDKLYAVYHVSSRLLNDVLPGYTWKQVMDIMIETDKNQRAEHAKIQQANARSLEMHYQQLIKQ